MTTTLPAGWKPRLSCPFCGSNCLFTEPDEVGSGGQWVSPIHVGCNDCQAEQVGDTEDEAVSRWNARFTPSASAQPARDWELDCDHCNGSGHVFVKHQVAELKTDVQEFKEECECCEGRGFVFAFQDIPEIEEYVKSCRPAIQHEPITVSLDPDPRGVSVGVWQGSHCIYNGAHAVPSAQDDAKESVMDAIASALGDAYDCTRVWAAWGVGTMSQDDFRLVADDPGRLGELADAAIAAMGPAPAAGDARDALLLTQALQELRQAFVIAVGDKSPFARIALEKADAAIAASQQQEG